MSGEPSLGSVYHRRQRTRYDLIKLLGTGAFGATYSATMRGDTSGRIWAIKVFEDRVVVDGQGREKMVRFRASDVKQEYLVSEVIRERMAALCQRGVVCARTYFFNKERTRGYIVFPYVEAGTLLAWLRTTLYPEMQSYRDALGTANGQEMALMTLDRIQSTAIWMTTRLINILDDLHSQSIYHRDLKPSNILVDGVMPLLIDFGLSCVIPDGLLDSLSNEPIIGCPDENTVGTKRYKDPLSAYAYPDSQPWTIARYTARFDTYALAKILQQLFDDDRANLTRSPVVRDTEFMPRGLYELLSDMTGERDGVVATPITEDLSVAEERRRFREFNRRPSMAEVALRFEEIYRQWQVEIDLRYTTPPSSETFSPSSSTSSAASDQSTSSQNDPDQL